MYLLRYIKIPQFYLYGYKFNVMVIFNKSYIVILLLRYLDIYLYFILNNNFFIFRIFDSIFYRYQLL